MSLGTVAAVVAIAGTTYGAVNSYQQGKAAKKAREAQLAAIADQQGALQGLYGEQADPVATFKEIFTSFPGLLEQVLPSLRRQSTESAKEFTGENIKIWDETLSKMFPDYKNQQARRIGILKEMDPANLGQEEIKAQTRMLAPLIPDGTLDPGTGAVAGGTSSPVSMYRNFISGLYQNRRDQFNQANNQFLADAENSAARQQVKAEAFLPSFLSAASQTAQTVTGQVLAQDQQNIAAQTSMLNAMLGMSGGYDPNASGKATAAAIQAGMSGVKDAYSLYKSGQQTSNPYSYNSGGVSSAAAAPAAAGTTSYYTGGASIT